MSDELAYVTFPGLENIESCSFTYQHGARPGIGTITTSPQANAPAHYGPLVFHFGNTRITLPNCALDSGVIENGGGKQMVRYTVVDRRWTWRYFRVRGAYNLYDDKGQVREDTKKTAKELAALCLEAMKEKNFVVGDMPEAYPSVEWDFYNAADALEDLCERTSCYIVYDYANDSIQVRRKGVGAMLPIDDTVMSGGVMIDPPELPGSIEFIGAPDEYQWDFRLEAVGKEKDGEIKLIDDLSYKPADGWNRLDVLGDWLNIADEELRQLAQQWVYRAYRIRFDNPNAGGAATNGGLNLPELPAISDKGNVFFRNRDALELLTYQLQTTEQEDGTEVFREPVIYGRYYAGGENLAAPDNVQLDTIKPLNQESDDDYHKALPVHVGYQIDAKNLIVFFNEPVYKNSAPDANGVLIEPADIYLRIAFRAREEKTNAYEHYREYGSAGGPQELYLTISDPNIVRRVYPIFNDDGGVDRLVDNATDFTTAAKPIIEATITALKSPSPMQVTYETIRAIRPDGAIQQIQWQCGGSQTPKTTAWRNNDVGSVLPSYQERRARAFARRQANEVGAANVVHLGQKTIRAASVFN